MPTPILSFDGVSSTDNANAFGFRVIPPDPNGDVGPNHYVQSVNSLTRVFDKSGNPMTPPFKLSSIFAPLGTPCSARDDGDPIVLDVKNLGKSFYSREGLFGKREFKAVKNVSFQLPKGKTLGLVGESGSGKTTVGLTLMRLHEATSGEAIFEG